MPGLIDFAPSVEALLEIEPEDLGLILISVPVWGHRYSVRMLGASQLQAARPRSGHDQR
jgi:hypothetical protein